MNTLQGGGHSDIEEVSVLYFIFYLKKLMVQLK